MILLTGIHGRPSTLQAFNSSKGDWRLWQKRFNYFRVFTERNSPYTKVNTFTKEKVIVRWGSRQVLDLKGCIIYNNSKAISNATNKRRSRELFVEEGVPTPKLYTPENKDTAEFPIIARPFTHAKGKNFIVLNTKEEFLSHFESNYSNGWYYSEFIDKEEEFRVHLGHGKVLAIMQKTPGKGHAWNRNQSGEPFTYLPWKSSKKVVIEAAVKAINALGLDMGGVDVIYKNKKAYVLEVNTAPTLNSSPYVASKWGQYFDWLNEDVRKPHFPMYQNKLSYFWKDKNFNS